MHNSLVAQLGVQVLAKKTSIEANIKDLEHTYFQQVMH